MAQKLSSTTGNVVIAFQQNPGVDNDSIINAGKAQNLDTGTDVNPVRGGYYCLRLGPGESTHLRIFNTDYVIQRKPANYDEAVGLTKIVSWDGIWDQNPGYTLQHYFQLLGYYPGNIDGNHRILTELALLGFEADNEYRTDGFGFFENADWKDKIEKVVNKKCKVQNKETGSEVYLIRKPLLRFTRSPSVADPTALTGPPDGEAPEVDDRGFIRAKANGHRCRGPVVSMAYERVGSDGNPGYGFRVKVIREGVGNNAPLVVESESPNYLSILTPNLPAQRCMNLWMRTGDPGNNSRKVRVYIKWQNSVNEWVIIATLRVIVLPMITVNVKPWRVGIKQDILHADDRLPDITNPQLMAVIERANAIWRPYGIKFRRLPCGEFHAKLKVADKVSKVDSSGNVDNVNGNHTRECKRIFNYSAAGNAINLYIVKEISGAFGITLSPFRTRNRAGIVLENRAGDQGKTGCTLAHELGHFLGLANNYGNPKHTHAEDDPDADEDNRKNDVWTIRRLMLGHKPSVFRPDDAWARNPGYGNDDRGRMISVRNLSKDKTDNECQNARKRAKSRSVYG